MLPGFSSPAVGFDTPFEMLEACHERVERSLRLLARLAEHLDREGWDEPARQAAGDVLRYFDVAAPLHHEDEERHVFPAALAAQDATITTAVHRLQQDHQDRHRAWQAVRTSLQRFAQDPGTGVTPPAPLAAGERLAWATFASLYEAHIRLEEHLVYPAASSRCGPQARLAMGEEMAARRGVRPPAR